MACLNEILSKSNRCSPAANFYPQNGFETLASTLDGLRKSQEEEAEKWRKISMPDLANDVNVECEPNPASGAPR